MKTLVIYRSKTGFSKNYAEWIAHQLNADLREARSVVPSQFVAYDTVIFGGGLYAGGINGISLIKQNLGVLRDKNVIVFATGASPVREETIAELRQRNFTPEELQQIRFFYFRGGFNFKRLQAFDKLLMRLMQLKLKLIPQKEQSSDVRGMLAAYSHPLDFTLEQNIAPLLLSLRP